MATSLCNESLDSKKAIEQCYENLIVVDIGANLTNKKYNRDLDSVVQRAKDAGKDECYLLNHVKCFGNFTIPSHLHKAILQLLSRCLRLATLHS